MKHDPYFKYLAAVILTGVFLAIADPTPVTSLAPETAPTAAAANR